MKKSIALLLVLMIAFAVNTNAQKNVKITWGSEFTLPDKAKEVGFIGDSKRGYVEVSHNKGKSISLQKFDTKLKLKGVTTLSTDALPKKCTIEYTESLAGHDYVFYSSWDKAASSDHLFAIEVDAEKGKFVGEGTELQATSDKITGTLVMTGFYNFQMVGKWNVVKSADDTKLMLYYRLRPEKKSDAINKDKIGIAVFDKDMKKMWSEEIEMPYTEKIMDNEDYQVDSKGNAYILAKVYEGDKKEKNAHYEVLMYNKEHITTPVINSFKFEDKYAMELGIIENTKGNIICVGYYSKKPNGKFVFNEGFKRGIDGTFFLQFDAGGTTMKPIHKGFYEFPVDVMKQYEAKGDQKRLERREDKGKDDEVFNLHFRKINEGDDGSITVYGEQSYSRTSAANPFDKSSSSTTAYYYLDIYATRIGPDGELKWVKKIPKSQVGNNSTFGLGFHEHSVGGNSYLFFVDNMKNLKIKPEEKPAYHTAGVGGVLMCVKIDADGMMTKSDLFNMREEKMNILVDKFSNVSPKEILGRSFKLRGMTGIVSSNGKPLLITVD